MAYSCNPSYSGDIVSGLKSKASPGQKMQTLSEKELKQKGLGAWLRWWSTQYLQNDGHDDGGNSIWFLFICLFV
jgi:hypothetical protein